MAPPSPPPPSRDGGASASVSGTSRSRDGAGNDAESLATPSHYSPPGYYPDAWEVGALETMRVLTIQLLCAGGSGAFAKTAVAPLERVKILLQVQPMSKVPPSRQYKGLLDALRRIRQEGGWRALYRGNGANVLRLIPEVAFKFSVNDQFKIMFAPADGRPPGVAEKLAAGAATGVLKTMLFYPLDVARVHLTARVPPFGPSAAAAGGADGTVRGALSHAVARDGMRGLYRGLLLSMAGVVPYLSLSFTAYDVLKQQLPETRAAHAAWWYPVAKMGCGAAAAAAAQTVTYPLDTVRRRLQVSSAPGQSVHYWSALHCVREMVAREGFASLYRGCAVNIMKTAPGAAIQFVAYDFIKTSIVAIDPRAGVQSPL